MHIISTTNHVSTKSDDVTVCCEDAAGTKHQMPWVTEKNEITNPPANPIPLSPLMTTVLPQMATSRMLTPVLRVLLLLWELLPLLAGQ